MSRQPSKGVQTFAVVVGFLIAVSGVITVALGYPMMGIALLLFTMIWFWPVKV
jgi:hypothetical protein